MSNLDDQPQYSDSTHSPSTASTKRKFPSQLFGKSVSHTRQLLELTEMVWLDEKPVTEKLAPSEKSLCMKISQINLMKFHPSWLFLHFSVTNAIIQQHLTRDLINTQQRSIEHPSQIKTTMSRRNTTPLKKDIIMMQLIKSLTLVQQLQSVNLAKMSNLKKDHAEDLNKLGIYKVFMTKCFQNLSSDG